MPDLQARRIRYSAVLALFLAVAFALLLRPSIRGHDGVLNYVYLRSLLVDGDLHFSNEYRHYLTLQAEWFNNEELPSDPVTDMPINLYGVGSSMMWTPWVAVAHVATAAAARGGWEVAADGYSRPYEWAVGLGSCFYATLGLWLLFRLCARLVGRRSAFSSVLAAWLASPLVFYMYLHPSMSHANSFLCAALLLHTYLAGDGVRRWLALGAIAGLLVAVRFQDTVLLGGFAAAELWRWRERVREDAGWAFLRSRVGRYLGAGLMAIMAFSPQLAAWSILQGSAFSGPRAYLMQGRIDLLGPRHLVEVLFSSRHGLFFWHPLLLAGVVGFCLLRRRPRVAMLALVAFAMQWWVVSSWSIWWGGASFGHRMFISTLPFLAIGLAAAARLAGHTRWGSVGFAVLILLGMLWNFGLIVQYGSGMIDRQKAVPMSELVRNNVLRVPRLLIGK